MPLAILIFVFIVLLSVVVSKKISKSKKLDEFIEDMLIGIDKEKTVDDLHSEGKKVLSAFDKKALENEAKKKEIEFEKDKINSLKRNLTAETEEDK